MARLAPTPRDTLWREGSSSLYRFRRPAEGGRGGGGASTGLPLVIVPSLINRWYVLDLRAGASLVEALVGGGLDVYCLDWGAPQDEDRYLEWDDIVARIGRAVRFVERSARASRVGLVGYCMGSTLAGIWAALEPGHVAAMVNLAGPSTSPKGAPSARWSIRRGSIRDPSRRPAT